ncbi:MAG: MerR family transcriptional regulator [Dehalococcoidales bacterium]|nr:MerR family transcriptional regulator [Dehalococcoidales bacterium]
MYLRIGDFSRLCRVTVRALRYYDEIGLLKPEKVDRITGYRYYSIDQLPNLNRIVVLKNIGLSLDDIDGLLHNNMPMAHIRQLLQVKQSEIQDRLQQDNEKLHQVKVWLDKICNEGTMPTVDIQKKEVPEITVVCKREFGTYDRTPDILKGELLRQILRPGNRKNVAIAGPVMMLEYDEEYKETDADIEMAIPITGEIMIDDPSIHVKTLRKCWVFSAIHKGPYHTLDTTYAQIFGYIEGQHLSIVTPIRELYFNDPEKVSESELLTEIQCPLKQQ